MTAAATGVAAPGRRADRSEPRQSRGVQRAVDEAGRLLVAAEAHAQMLAELGDIELPPAVRAAPMQMRAVASLYLASTLEAAGLTEAADDFARLGRTGSLPGDLGDAAPLVAEFWNGRASRASSAERSALFASLFGSAAGPVDAAATANDEFEELLLDLCDAIIEAADQGGSRHVRASGDRLAENVANAASDTVLLMARDIIGTLSQAIAILNHPQVRSVLGARTMWDAVAAIDRRFRRPPRPTLSYLRRGRAGMTVLAWLADILDGSVQVSGSGRPNDMVVDAAVEWVDETLAIIHSQEGDGAAAQPGRSADRPGPPSPGFGGAGGTGGSSWFDLAR